MNLQRPAGFACFLLAAALCHGQVPTLHSGNSFSANGCFAKLEGDRLSIGNSLLQRTWLLNGQHLEATSFQDRQDAREWVLPPAKRAHTDLLASALLRGATGRFSPTEESSLRAELTLGAVRYEFQVFPDVAGVRMWMETTPASPAASDSSKGASPDPLESLLLDAEHLKLVSVTMRDQTDTHNELVAENEWLLQPNDHDVSLRGNLFTLEDTFTGDGLVFLKEAPEPDSRPDPGPTDFRYIPHRTEKGTDISFENGGSREFGETYRWVVLAYEGGPEGRIKALHQYQRALRTYVPGRDGLLLSNTWGDRSGPEKISADFVKREIEAGQKLGVDETQVDDGWQLGVTRNLVRVGGAYEVTPDYWTVNKERLSGGIAPLSDFAHAHSMKLGLWFAPDSMHDFAQWQADVDRLLQLRDRAHVDGFKFDMVRIESKEAEHRYQQLLSQIQVRSNGKLLLDLDVTAGVRQGYWGNIEAGPLFVENRYTDWHTYWPHQTLRNLWELANYVDPVRLRMEFLNNARNPALYAGDPIAPGRYSPSYLFATVMFASPLAWLETSNLSPAYVASVKPVIDVWKRERDNIYRGITLPIGSKPDGVNWTGFASVNPDGGYLLVFRENSRDATWTTPSKYFKGTDFEIVRIAGTGSLSSTTTGLTVSIPDARDFALFKISAVHAETKPRENN